MADDLIGQNLGQYQIRMLLGRGGMSTVYLAYQPSMERTVAIKVLPPEFLHDETFLARFQQEARVIARLEHLHILPVYDVGEEKGIPFIVSRYLPGGTLSDLINRGTPEHAVTVRLITQVADALDYAHERGIIHRDLKPSNVLLDNTSNAFLADFGIARVAQQAASMTGSRIVGTPPYVAPEMVRKNERVTHSADVYALGIIAYELLIGTPPFMDEDPMKVLMAHVLEPVPSPRDVDPNIGVAIDSVMRRVLSKNADERYRTAGAFARALEEAVESESETTPAGVTDEPAHTLDDTSPVAAQRGARAGMQAPPPPPAAAPPRPQASPARPSSRASARPLPADRKRAREKRAEVEKRSRPGGCWIGLVVILLVLGGLALTAFAVTGGDLSTWLPGAIASPDLGGNAAEPSREPTSDGPGEVVSDSTPEPSPGPGRLAFASNRDGDYEIFLVDADGSNLEQITFNDTFDFDPDWSPDAEWLVYASSAGGDPEIMVMRVDGSEARQLTDNTARDADPAWSPDGQWIAFSSNRDGDFDIYIMRPDGSDVRPVTFNDRDDFTPTWSPDGRQLAYYVQNQDDESSADLYLISVFEGTPPRRLTDNTWLDKWPDWSPDGGTLVFTSAQGLEPGQRALFTYDLQSGAVAPLMAATIFDDDPVWSRDGTRVALDSNRDGDGFFDLFILDVRTGNLRQITDGAANNVAPAWQP